VLVTEGVLVTDGVVVNVGVSVGVGEFEGITQLGSPHPFTVGDDEVIPNAII